MSTENKTPNLSTQNAPKPSNVLRKADVRDSRPKISDTDIYKSGSDRTTDERPGSAQISPNAYCKPEAEEEVNEDFTWPAWLDPDGKLSRNTYFKELISHPDVGKPRPPTNLEDLYSMEDLGDSEIPVDTRTLKRGKSLLCGDGWVRKEKVKQVALFWTFTPEKQKPVDPRSGPSYVLEAQLRL